MLTIHGGIACRDIYEMCGRALELFEQKDPALILCDVTGITNPNAVTVEALARLRLIAQRSGRRMYVSRCGDELRDLIRLMGLMKVLGPPDLDL